MSPVDEVCGQEHCSIVSQTHFSNASNIPTPFLLPRQIVAMLLEQEARLSIQ